MTPQTPYLDRRLSDRENEYLLCLLEAFGNHPLSIKRTTRGYSRRKAVGISKMIHHGEQFNVPSSMPIIVKLAADAREEMERDKTVENAFSDSWRMSNDTRP